MLNAIVMGWAKENSPILMELVSPLYLPTDNIAGGPIQSVESLGHDSGKDGPLDWKADPDGLIVHFPGQRPCEHAFVLKITLE